MTIRNSILVSIGLTACLTLAGCAGGMRNAPGSADACTWRRRADAGQGSA